LLRRLSAAAPLGFDAGAVYALKATGDGVIINWQPAAYAELDQRIRVNVRGGVR
jgi:hypothetical protein